MTFIKSEFRLRRGDWDEWNEKNPTLGDGEPGYDSTANRLKIGDGVTAWNDLPYLTGDSSGGGGEVDLLPHINSSEPHPAYDDIQSLTVLFENGLI